MSRHLIFVTLTQTLLTLICLTKSDKLVPCHLTWIRYSSGQIPSTAIASHETVFLYVARLKIENSYIIGTFNEATKTPYFNTQTPNATTGGVSGFEILANPFNCSTKWSPNSGGHVDPNSVLVDRTQEGTPEEEKEFVGRKIVRDSQWYAGTISLDQSGCIVGIEEGDQNFFDSYEVLTSFTNGLLLEVTDFVFEADIEGSGNEFSGVQEIHNVSPATLVQTIHFTRRVTETYRVTVKKTFVATKTTTVTTKIFFVTIKKETKQQWTEETEETKETIEVTEITVRKKVIVPPFSSVEACSKISIKEEASIPYTAVGKYSAPTLSPLEVQRILIADGIQNSYILDDFVLIDLDGTMDVKVAMNTEFIVNDIGSATGCSALIAKQKEIDHEKKMAAKAGKKF